MTGNGKYSFANGDTYDGGWVSGVMEGRGVYRTHTGVVYNGQMSGCRFHGSGTLTTPLGDKYVIPAYPSSCEEGLIPLITILVCRYEGQFVDNAPSGKGTLTFNDGKDVYEGDFVDVRTRDNDRIYLSNPFLFVLLTFFCRVCFKDTVRCRRKREPSIMGSGGWDLGMAPGSNSPQVQFTFYSMKT